MEKQYYIKKKDFARLIRGFNFAKLFNEFGWDRFEKALPISLNEKIYQLKGIAEKRGFTVFNCGSSPDAFPKSAERRKIENKLTPFYNEHLIIYTASDNSRQIWQLKIQENNKPKQIHEVPWYLHQDTEILFQRLRNIFFTLEEEEDITIVDVQRRISENFAKNTDKVTKKFYDEFKIQHRDFLKFINGIDDNLPNPNNSKKQWYASLMLNRLMFCYFIQKKGFLDQDINYLKNKLNECRDLSGSDNFYGFYRSFLLRLFHDGLGKPKEKREDVPSIDMGKVPYLNGGLFDIHELEKQFKKINIPDEAFSRIFYFFDQWNWHLDTRIEASGKDINPDVLGHIFEKYINARADMGAYYTKEDITGYIGRNTIIPFLFEETQRHYSRPFKKGGEFTGFVQESGDAYIFDAVKKAVPKSDIFSDLPEEIKAGFKPEMEKQLVAESEKPHLWELRKPWNRSAPSKKALPTETWRELIARRKRCQELRKKINTGQIEKINDFITYSLDICQFAQDYIANTADAKFIGHFYHAIQKITVLDPTCGSGAFLFAALNLLEPLYEECITRMEQFTTEEEGKHKFFEETLREIDSDKHPSLKYYIYKSIILNNLYGVDIMKEAAEIAKLRLFLKLVATVDPNPAKESYGLEPLPDIDFNIKAGNTLIGYSTEEKLKESIEKKDGMFAKNKLEKIEEECQLISQAYRRFQDSQLISDQGSKDFEEAKTSLNRALSELNHKLNGYLCADYGIQQCEEIDGKDGQFEDPQKMRAVTKKYDDWLKSHQPFHWFAEFYQIVVANGGFDVIIGNPPYVEYSKVKKKYKISNYETEKCGNLYAMVFEQCRLLLCKSGHIGMIVQNSIACTKRMIGAQKLLANYNLYYSHYDDRPAKLFTGIHHMKGTIFLISNKGKANKTYSTKFYRWHDVLRYSLFQSIKYIEYDKKILQEGHIPKLSENIHSTITKKYIGLGKIDKKIEKQGPVIYIHRIASYFIKALLEIPYFYNDEQGVKKSSDYKVYSFKSKNESYKFLALFNSTFFYMYWHTFYDGYHCGKESITFFFCSNLLGSNLNELGKNIGKDLIANSIRKETLYKSTGKVIYDEFYPKKSKPIIDKIDTVLAQHYGFTEEELDFIINYDIKYRMGKELKD